MPVVKSLKILSKPDQKLLTKIGLLVEAEAREKCPVDTGILKASITSWTDDNSAYIGTNMKYGVYVHEGTGIYAENGRKTPWRYKTPDGNWHTTKGQEPQPFLEEALNDKKQEILELVKESILNG